MKDFNQLGVEYRGVIDLGASKSRRPKKKPRKTVKEIIAALSEYPEDAFAYAYEGEITGIVVVGKNKKGREVELGYIETSET